MARKGYKPWGFFFGCQDSLFIYLFLLDRNGLISWDKRKTNVAYLYEIKDIRIKSVFRELSWVFDCVCYGDFVIGESAFQQIENKFKVFQKEIGG